MSAEALCCLFFVRDRNLLGGFYIMMVFRLFDRSYFRQLRFFESSRSVFG